MKIVPPNLIAAPQVLYQPIETDLQLTTLSGTSVLKFFEDYKKLQQKQRTIPLRLGDFLAPNVIRQLVADATQYDEEDLNDRVVGDTLLLDSDRVMEMIIRYIRPTSKESLLKALARHTKFPPLPSGYVVTASYYQPMWRATERTSNPSTECSLKI
jgi:hypothetical protein